MNEENLRGMTSAQRTELHKIMDSVRPALNAMRDSYADALLLHDGDDDRAFTTLLARLALLQESGDLDPGRACVLLAFAIRRLSNKRSDLVSFSAN
jgi:hypothetical protein